jgi:hypothetical protein
MHRFFTMTHPLFIRKEQWRKYLDGHFKKFTEHIYVEQNKKRQQIVSFLSFIREEGEKNAFGAWERTVAYMTNLSRLVT